MTEPIYSHLSDAAKGQTETLLYRLFLSAKRLDAMMGSAAH